MRRLTLLILLLLPVVAIGAWIGLLLVDRTSDPALRIAIRGFDPRDLLRGHFLLFQLDLRTDTVGSGPACLVPDSADPLRPVASPPWQGCPYPVADTQRSYRYYLPEETALELQRLLAGPAEERGEEVTVQAHFTPAGDLSFSDIRVGVREP